MTATFRQLSTGAFVPAPSPSHPMSVGARVVRTRNGSPASPIVPFGTLGRIVAMTENGVPEIVWDTLPDVPVTYRATDDRYAVVLP